MGEGIGARAQAGFNEYLLESDHKSDTVDRLIQDSKREFNDLQAGQGWFHKLITKLLATTINLVVTPNVALRNVNIEANLRNGEHDFHFRFNPTFVVLSKAASKIYRDTHIVAPVGATTPLVILKNTSLKR